MIRGTRRPGGAGRTRGSSSGRDMGDSLGPGDSLLSGCGSFLNGLFWTVVIIAVCVAIGVLL